MTAQNTSLNPSETVRINFDELCHKLGILLDGAPPAQVIKRGRPRKPFCQVEYDEAKRRSKTESYYLQKVGRMAVRLLS